MNTQAVACAGFGKWGQIESVQGTDVRSVVQGAKPWQRVCPSEGRSPLRSWSTFSTLYMKFSCHVTANVTKNTGLLERSTNEIVQIFHTLWKIF